MCGAARGWARYIECNYPLCDVRFVWRSRSLPAHLVSASTASQPGSSGFYLFDETLSQGRLVAQSWSSALDNLRETPVKFEGNEILQAGSRTGQETSDLIQGEDMVMG